MHPHHHELAGTSGHEPANHHRSHLDYRHQHRAHDRRLLRPELDPEDAKTTQAHLATLPSQPHDLHGDWN
jgi:hypothetical protein